MPQIFKVGNYIVYFWSNEGVPREPVHVHIAPDRPTSNGTKVWLTCTGRALLCHNKAQIPFSDLRKLMRMIEANNEEILEQWKEFFGEARFYC